MIKIPCEYGVDHEFHEFPDDWQFGGARGTHPAADPRWKPTTYEYWNEFRVQRLFLTQTPLCDDQALDEFTKIANRGPKWNPTMLMVIRPDGKPEVLPWIYNKETDELSPRS